MSKWEFIKHFLEPPPSLSEIKDRQREREQRRLARFIAEEIVEVQLLSRREWLDFKEVKKEEDTDE